MRRVARIAQSTMKNRMLQSLQQKVVYHFDDNYNKFYKEKNENLIHPTYTSKHFKVSSSSIVQYLEDKKMEHKIQGKYVQLRYCPFCPKHNIENPSNQFVMGINLENGSYNCFRATCQARGSWFDFKNFMNGNLNSSQQQNQQSLQQPTQKLNIFEYHQYYERLKLQEPKIVYDYLTGDDWENNQRGIKDDVLKLYLIGIDITEIYDPQQGSYVQAPLIYFPMFRYRNQHERNKLIQKALKQKKDEVLAEQVMSEETKQNIKSQLDNQFDNLQYELVSCKIRAAGKDLKHIQKIEPMNAAKGIFGMHLLKQDSTQVILTEGEFDAMAAYQMTNIPAISLPYGINHIPAYLIEWLDQFEKLNDIIIWVDDDNPGRINSQKIARKLGNARTRVVQPSLLDPHDYPKDANDCLRFYADRVMNYIDQSKCLLKKNITQFTDFKQLTKNRILNFELSKGTQSQSFTTYNNTTKGLRTGEFTILTGPTGSGKTTFLSQLSLDFCKEGITTLWGSFEIKTDRLAEHQLLQAYKTDLIKQKDLIDVAVQKFENEMPIYYMNFYGSTDLDQIIDTIEYAIYEYNVTHVCLDNLQFMMGTQVGGNRKFDFQDEIIEKFRRLTSNNDIHLTLVIHPRKVDENEDLTIASIFGSAKATQEADNVFIIQNRPRYRVFEIKKNRYDGEVGRVGLGFDSNVKSFFELTSAEVKELNEEKTTILDIISKRKQEGRHFKQEITINDKNGNNDGGNNEGGSPNKGGNHNNSPINPKVSKKDNLNAQKIRLENIEIPDPNIFKDINDDEEDQMAQLEKMTLQYANQEISEIIINEKPVKQALDDIDGTEPITKVDSSIVNSSVEINEKKQVHQDSHTDAYFNQGKAIRECQKCIDPSNDYLEIWKFDQDSDYGLQPKIGQYEPKQEQQTQADNNQTQSNYNEFALFNTDPLNKFAAQKINKELDQILQSDEFQPVDDQIELSNQYTNSKSKSKRVSFIHVGSKKPSKQQLDL
ncbi:unnamed protein product [Paramecium octaurelia]|uniref:SF4 helicase domain-containing protein n=1 Tax=Paramecium octaurelia TaxID=43137 RepID=A0A8S1SX03_PAROT|nr:unnamed protein product [Paramecium octaurelia]